jgi:hypothetical protein
MSSDLQLIANRENAKHSTGPRTPEGKNRTRLNAFRHGLTGHLHFLTPEDRAAFESHCAAILDSIKPADALESALAHSIAHDLWRLQRAQAIEDSLLAQVQIDRASAQPAADPDAPIDLDAQALAQARAWRRNSHQLELLTVYSARLNRSVSRNMRELEDLQARRAQLREQIIHEQYLESRYAQARASVNRPGKPYVIEEHLDHSARRCGFVFSPAELLAQIQRVERLEDARHMQKLLWEPLHMPLNWPREYTKPGPITVPK